MYGDIDNEFTIMKVYKPIKIKNLKSLFNMDDSIFARNEMELLWERKAIPTEQEQHINELEEQIEEMKQKVSAMEQKVSAMEQKVAELKRIFVKNLVDTTQGGV